MVSTSESGDDQRTFHRNAQTSLGLDFLKFFATSAVAGLFLAGFVYTIEYYNSFGLSALEVDVGYFEAAAYGTYLLNERSTFLAVLLTVIAASLIVSFARFRFGDLGFYISIVVLSICLCPLAVYLGDTIAKKHSSSVLTGLSGTIANCTFSSHADAPKEFRDLFRSEQARGTVRKVIATDRTIYFVFADPNYEEGTRGTTYAIKRTDINYCRFDSDHG